MIKEPLTQKDVNKAAINYEEELTYRPKDMYDDQKSFIAGAVWRINSVWHDCNDRSTVMNNKDEVVLLLENGKIVEYEDNWEEYCSLVKKWAYKKDLLPNKQD